jgi:hypothetical protein
MDKCIQFNGLSPLERAKVLEMVKSAPSFWALLEESAEPETVSWLLDQAAEHFTYMNKITGGAYGAAAMDV